MEATAASREPSNTLPDAKTPPKFDRAGSHDTEGSISSRVAHTLAACTRCRNRKTRCDAGLPRCVPCERNGATCEYFDTTKGKKIPRTYVIYLQERVRELEAELAIAVDEELREPDAEALVRGAGLVKFEDSEEPRYIGSSSGVTITRLIMELAKQNTESKSIREVIPDRKYRKYGESDDQEKIKQYPLISAVAASNLPTRGMTDQLTKIFNQKAQFMLPTLHEPTFQQDVQDVYDGSDDPYQNFVVRMVLAISLQKLDTQYAGLADSYYLAALSFMDAVVQPMNLKSLQCFVLIAQYSLLTPTRTAVYYIVGMAAKLCQQLGLNREKTIFQTASPLKLDPVEKDMRRRLFWIVMSMEYALSHVLGRPCAFAIHQDLRYDVGFFEEIDDEYITINGILPAPPSLKKQIAIHFFKMRLLQAEIRRMLHQKKRDEPKDDNDPWFAEMETKLELWKSVSPGSDGGSGLSSLWFTGRYNTMIVFLYRPSPQIPRPSVRAAFKCYDASVFNIHMQNQQMETRSIDLTWVFVSSLCMAINAILWTVSFPDVRQAHSREEVEGHLDTAMASLYKCSERWPGCSSAYQLYQRLRSATLKFYDFDNEALLQQEPVSSHPSPLSYTELSRNSSASYNDFSKASPSSQQDISKSSPLPYLDYSKASPASFNENSNQSSPSPTTTLSFSLNAPFPEKPLEQQFGFNFNEPFSQAMAPNLPAAQYQTLPNFDYSGSFNLPNLPGNFNPYNNASNGRPSLINWDSNFSDPVIFSSETAFASQLSNPDLYPTDESMFSMQFWGGQQGQASLSQEEQLEMMNTLETDGLQVIGQYLDHSAKMFKSIGIARC
ncbi:MAG: hypothetical protein M1829_004055 [Trizodia sp. TS-e1964]|nr:MAG: hypothetical protein M1829_004055 [Trizodia sp. TS-e1964]